jgi:hypothetical protein
MARDRSLYMARRRCRLRYMAVWLEDHVVAIVLFKLKSWLNWRPGRVRRWKGETVNWEGRGVICGNPVPSRLYPRLY